MRPPSSGSHGHPGVAGLQSRSWLDHSPRITLSSMRIHARSGAAGASRRASRSASEVGRARSGQGLCVLVGVTHDDTAGHARKLADKIWHLRVMDDDAGRDEPQRRRHHAARCWSSASSRCTATPTAAVARAGSPLPGPSTPSRWCSRWSTTSARWAPPWPPAASAPRCWSTSSNDGPVTVLLESDARPSRASRGPRCGTVPGCGTGALAFA